MRVQHRERNMVNRRIEELKLRVMRLTERQMDQAVRLIRRWLHLDKKS